MLLNLGKHRTTQAVRKFSTRTEALTSKNFLATTPALSEIPRKNKNFSDTTLFWLKNLLFIGILLSLVGGFLLWLLHPNTLPITEIQLENHVHTTPEDLQAAVSIDMHGGFFNVDVHAVHAAAMTLPWVKAAIVRRLWPNTLQVQIQERQAVAEWRTVDKDRVTLVDSEGHLFTLPRKPPGLADLPIFTGTLDQVTTVLTHYEQLKPLLTMASFNIREIGCDTRQSWYLVLNNGMQLLLGRSDNEKRLQRLFKVYTHIITHAALSNLRQRVAPENLVMDLRYTNAIVVRLANEAEHAQR